MLPAAGANQLLGTPLPPHPQLQRLLFLINLMLINLIARPAQNLRPIVASSHATKCTESLPPSEPNKTRVRYRFLRRAQFPELNILINNAGIMREIKVHDKAGSLEDITQEVEINLNGPIRMVK